MEAFGLFASWPITVTKAQFPSRGVMRMADSSSPERGLRMTALRCFGAGQRLETRLGVDLSVSPNPGRPFA